MGEMHQAALTELSASELARQIASRRLSATEAVKAHIKRIEEVDSRIRAVVVPLFEQALAEAGKADGMSAQGRPLHGVPVTVKECFHVKGTASTSYAQNIGFVRDAFGLVTVPMELPGGVDFAAREMWKNISMRIIRAYDIVNDVLPVRIDILYGVSAYYQELACRLSN